MTTTAEKMKAAKKAAEATTAPAVAAPVAAETIKPADVGTDATVTGEAPKKERTYRTREENVEFWTNKKAKLTEEYNAKITRYDAHLAKLTAPRKRAVVDVAVVDDIVETMTEQEIQQKRAEFEAALKKSREKKAAAADVLAPDATEATEGDETPAAE